MSKTLANLSLILVIFPILLILIGPMFFSEFVIAILAIITSIGFILAIISIFKSKKSWQSIFAIIIFIVFWVWNLGLRETLQ